MKEMVGWSMTEHIGRKRHMKSARTAWSKLNVAFYQFCLAGNAKKNTVCRICLRHDHQTADCNKNYQRPGYPTPDMGFSRPVNSGVEICRLYNAMGESKCKYRECKFCKSCIQLRSAKDRESLQNVARDKQAKKLRTQRTILLYTFLSVFSH